MSEPIAVVISDVHYSLKNLELSDFAFRAAIDKAHKLGVPLIDAGDITNDKAILRAEVVNRLIETMIYAKDKDVEVYLLVGNHSLCNEKGDEHSLNFLYPHANVISHTCSSGGFNFVPYQSDPKNFIRDINRHDRLIICHQGFHGADMGDYVHDKSAIDVSLVKDFTVISGHYHKHQTIGTVTYVGNPYTMSFGEANDGSKGFLILNADGTFTREILNLRRHRIREFNSTVEASEHILPFGELFASKDDLLWIKIKDTKENLKVIDKKSIGEFLGMQNFKLDLIPTDSPLEAPTNAKGLTDGEILDSIIDTSSQTEDAKIRLKALWRNLT